ncbi:MAG: Fic family protein [Nanoarchaeota archaeon]
MAFLSTKIIKGKKQWYLERSVRLPIGNVKKFSIYIKEYRPLNKEQLQRYTLLLNEKVSCALINAVGDYYQDHSIFTKEQIKKMEKMKLGYKELLKQLTSKQYQDIIDRFTVNFTYEANAIEGNSLTLKDVTMLFHEKNIPRGMDLRHVHETLNTRKALEALFYHKIKIREKDILALHETLVKDTGVSFGYKKFPNFLLGRNVQTTAPEHTASEMQKLFSWYHTTEKMHPLQKAALFHARFEKIHPFEDGNGRVGRILLNAILLEHGYPPLIIRKTQRVAYFGALAAADKNHYEKLFHFLIEKYKKTYQQFFEVYVKYL